MSNIYYYNFLQKSIYLKRKKPKKLIGEIERKYSVGVKKNKSGELIKLLPISL